MHPRTSGRPHRAGLPAPCRAAHRRLTHQASKDTPRTGRGRSVHPLDEPQWLPLRASRIAADATALGGRQHERYRDAGAPGLRVRGGGTQWPDDTARLDLVGPGRSVAPDQLEPSAPT
jgi:hypothetical protein